MTHSVLNRGDHSDTGKTVRISDLVAIEEAYSTSRVLDGTDDYWAAAEYIERMEDQVTGDRYDVVYLFSEEDMEFENGASCQESDYPFDEDHIARVFAVYNDER